MLTQSIKLLAHRDESTHLPVQVVVAAKTYARSNILNHGHAGLRPVFELARGETRNARKNLLKLKHGREGIAIDTTAGLHRLRANVVNRRQGYLAIGRLQDAPL